MKFLIAEVDQQASRETKKEPRALLTQAVSHCYKCRLLLSDAGVEIRENEDLTALMEELVPIPMPNSLFFVVKVVKPHDNFSRPLIFPSQPKANILYLAAVELERFLTRTHPGKTVT